MWIAEQWMVHGQPSNSPLDVVALTQKRLVASHSRRPSKRGCLRMMMSREGDELRMKQEDTRCSVIRCLPGRCLAALAAQLSLPLLNLRLCRAIRSTLSFSTLLPMMRPRPRESKMSYRGYLWIEALEDPRMMAMEEQSPEAWLAPAVADWKKPQSQR